jgi:Putative auto-transporter adhesin, head GIN domain
MSRAAASPARTPATARMVPGRSAPRVRAALALPMIAVLAAAVGCGALRDAGPVKEDRRTFDQVTAVDLRTSGNLTIVPGDAPVLTITAGANQLPELTTEVDNGRLILDNKSGMAIGTFSYQLAVPSLSGITVDGSGSVQGDGVVTGEFDAEVSGSGSLTLTNVDSPAMTLRLDGSGDATVSGTAVRQTVDLSGSGQYDGSNLASQDAEVSVSGSGDASVDVSDRLAASVSGSGSVNYTGSPTTVDRDVSGSGDVTGG